MGCGGSELIVCSAHSPHDQKSFNKRIAFCASTRPQANAEPIDLDIIDYNFGWRGNFGSSGSI
jgi:hypothetical protein